jgi:hypothetical protein
MPASLDSTLKQINRQTEESSAQELASRLGLSYADLTNYPFNLETLRLMPVSLIQEKQYSIICMLRIRLE